MTSAADVAGLWIDNDATDLEASVSLLKREGVSPKLVSSAEQGLQELKNNPDAFSYVLLDLNMPGMSGVEAYWHIRSINKHIPIIWVSAHLTEDRWNKKLAKIDEELLQIEKPFPMATTSEFRKKVSLIRESAIRYKEGILDSDPRPRSSPSKGGGPFGYTLARFRGLSFAERMTVFKNAERLAAKFVEQYFQTHQNLDWIVLAGGPSRVVAEGVKQSEPGEEKLEEFAEEEGVPVFLYSRPKVVEETGTWSAKGGGDFYPTVSFRFYGYGSTYLCTGDFDTGSNTSFFSYEKVLSSGILKEKMWAGTSAVLWGKSYQYFADTLSGEIISDSGNSPVRLQCELVVDWDSSPLVSNYKNRVALVGRNLLLDNDIRVVLDGPRRKTYILNDGSEGWQC